MEPESEPMRLPGAHSEEKVANEHVQQLVDNVSFLTGHGFDLHLISALNYSEPQLFKSF